MKRNNTIEQEIDKIRLDIYEETKDMTPAQLTEYYRKNTDPIIEKYGFNVIATAVKQPEIRRV